MEFEWDNEKNLANIKNHNIDFETAARVFGDPFRLERKKYYENKKKYRP